jgi:hypothetical protein
MYFACLLRLSLSLKLGKFEEASNDHPHFHYQAHLSIHHSHYPRSLVLRIHYQVTSISMLEGTFLSDLSHQVACSSFWYSSTLQDQFGNTLGFNFKG